MRAGEHASNLWLAGVVAAVAGAGCASVKPPVDRSEERLSLTIPLVRVVREEPRDSAPVAPPPAEFSSDHVSVRRFVERYRSRSRRTLEGAFDRAGRHLPWIEQILEEEGVPLELAFLPIVESGFRLRAVSPAGAAGPWQMMGRTARHYGLRVDRLVDERLDIERSTRAAARYLRDLHERFGDWLLALAAYNSGEAKVARVRSARQVRSYWSMIERNLLPRETSEFVPRFLAVLRIARSPERHGFDRLERRTAFYDAVQVDRSIDLRTVAELCGSSLATIRELNPGLRRGVVPSGYPLRLPRGTKRRFDVAYSLRGTAPAIAAAGFHRVRRGETPVSIARRYGVSVHRLMRVNGIENPRKLRVNMRLRIPTQPI